VFLVSEEDYLVNFFSCTYTLEMGTKSNRNIYNISHQLLSGPKPFSIVSCKIVVHNEMVKLK
jgi:hypothetical protein